MWERVIGAVAALVVVASLQSPSAGRENEDQLPNLVALPPFDIQIGEADRASRSDPAIPAIRFATGAANRSDYALELMGRPSSATEATAQQCVAWAAPRLCSEREDVGKFAWHPQHGHYHFEDFALYELRKLRRDGRPIMRKKGLVATSGKISYCIIDGEKDESRGVLYELPYPLYYSCLAGLSMQGISPGWRDIYSKSTVGQQIPLEGVADGDYALMVFIDPVNRLAETKNDDNHALARIRLTEGGTKIQVVCAQEPGNKECLEPTRS